MIVLDTGQLSHRDVMRHTSIRVWALIVSAGGRVRLEPLN